MKRQLQDALIQNGWKHVLGEPPEKSGIYAFLTLRFFEEWSCAYVGQSRDLATRFAGHRLYCTALWEGHEKVERWVLECPLDQLNALERQYIRLLKPRHNGADGSDVNRKREIERTMNVLMRKINRNKRIKHLGESAELSGDAQ